MNIIENFLVGTIGRPILLLVRWLRWPLLFMGFYFNGISSYNPNTGITSSKFTVLPFVIGIAMFSVGTTLKRYEDNIKFYKEKAESHYEK